MAKEKLNPARKKVESRRISETQKVTMASNVIVPLGLWINLPEKGKKNPLTHTQLVDQWKKEEDQLRSVLEITQTIQNVKKAAINIRSNKALAVKALNLTVIDEMTKVLSSPKQLADALRWQMKNQTRIETIKNQDKDPGDPLRRKALVEKNIRVNQKNMDEAMALS